MHRLADHYFALDAFARNAGREVTAATYDEDYDGTAQWKTNPASLENVVLRMFEAGHDRVLLKAGHGKQTMIRFDRADGFTLDTIRRDLHAFEWFPWHHVEGRVGAVLVQEYAPMEYKYRLRVIGGQLITGAGAINAFTPFNNEAPFDPKVDRHRYRDDQFMTAEADPYANAVWGEAHPTAAVPETVRESVEARPDLVAAYLVFARTVVAELATEVPEMADYTLDVAMIGGRPAVVELNSHPNSGLYACDPNLIAQAVAHSPHLCEFGNPPAFG